VRWGPKLLAELEFFRLRQVEVHGARYLAPEEIVSRLRVDSTASIWNDLEPLERMVAGHAQVQSVDIDRKLPGTLVIHVTERLPVAFVPAADGMRAVDAAGRTLPIDPSRTAVDLPVLARGDSAMLRLLVEVREEHPELFDRISEIRRVGRSELIMDLATLRVRTSDNVSADRLADILPVETDLARRRVQIRELDLRYRDQVVARLQ
jgi:cell division protein FtsQ